MYLFSWDNVPGKDNGKLIEYLEQKYGVDWVRTAKIEKIDNNEIRIATEKNFLSLKLNNENTKVTLTINNVRTDEFIVKTENSKLNIYKDIEQEKKDIRQGVKVERHQLSLLVARRAGPRRPDRCVLDGLLWHPKRRHILPA